MVLITRFFGRKQRYLWILLGLALAGVLAPTNAASLGLVHATRSARQGIMGVWVNTTLWERLVDFSPYLAGRQALMEHNPAAAIPLLEGATGRPDLANWYHGLALRQMGREAESLALLAKSGASDYYLTMGHMDFRIRDIPAACSDYLFALEIAPDDAEVNMYAGHCHIQSGRNELAEQAYMKAIRLDPNFGYPYIHLANLYRSRYKDDARSRQALLACIQTVQDAHWKNECQVELERRYPQ